MTSPLSGSMAKAIYKGMKGLFLDATLTRDGANSGPAYDPATAAATEYSCKAIPISNTKGVEGVELAGSTEVAVLILKNSLSVAPESLDRIDIPSKGVSGVVASRDKAVNTDPAGATWQCWVVT